MNVPIGFQPVVVAALTMLLSLSAFSAEVPSDSGVSGASKAAAETDEPLEAGQRMYRKGILPSGKLMTGIIQGDIPVTGEQVICGRCHRRSGMGSTEGQEVVPPLTGDLLYAPLRLPTSKPPLAPALRPAYTDESLKRAIRDGIGPGGEVFNPLMPRYPLTDAQLDMLIGYLKTLSTAPDPGVGEREIHLATIVSEGIDAQTRAAFLKVFDAFIEQKNTETRHETVRAEHAPWHKEAVYAPYRKWVLHVWELKGARATWPEQLRAMYEQQPVFAVISGLAPGSWQPVHEFCEQSELPCLFPMTDLPVVAEADFYTVYFSPGIFLEADAIARHIHDEGLLSSPVVQVFRVDDPRAATAAAQLRQRLTERGGAVTGFAVSGQSAVTEELWSAVVEQSSGGTLVLWLGEPDLDAIMRETPSKESYARIYLSATLYDGDPAEIEPALRDRVYLAYPYELPDKWPRLLTRSTGWLKSKRVDTPEAQHVQANAFFALNLTGGALKQIQGYFLRDYLLEQIEHMTQNATFTSVYPRMNLAPGQRFVSRGAYIARVGADGSDQLIPVTDWFVPASNQ